MKHLKKVFILILGIVLFTSCDCIEGDGPIVSEQRNIDGFDGIEVEASVNVFVSKSNQFNVEVRAQQNILDILRTRVRGRTLVIEFDEMCVMNTRSIDVYISMPELSEIQIDGSGDVESEDVFGADEVYFGISGSGSIDMEILASSVEVSVNGSGNVYLSGEADYFISSIRGSGDIRANRLKAERAKVKIGGSGSTYIYVLDELDAHISGSGSIHYGGRPTIDSRVNGSGRLRRI